MVFGGQSMRSLIQRLFVQQSWLCTTIAWLAAVLAPPPIEFDERLWGSLSKATRAHDRRALNDFLGWAGQHNHPDPQSVHELDALLLAYLYSGISTSKFRVLLAAVEKALPAAKKRLVYASAHIIDLGRRMPPRHTVPLSYIAAAGTAWVLASRNGQPRVAALLLLQTFTGFRPSEALQLQRQHLVPGHMNQSSPGTAVILLGVKHGTKIGRPQFVSVTNAVACMLILAFYNTTPSGAL